MLNNQDNQLTQILKTHIAEINKTHVWFNIPIFCFLIN